MKRSSILFLTFICVLIAADGCIAGPKMIRLADEQENWTVDSSAADKPALLAAFSDANGAQILARTDDGGWPGDSSWKAVGELLESSGLTVVTLDIRTDVAGKTIPKGVFDGTSFLTTLGLAASSANSLGADTAKYAIADRAFEGNQSLTTVNFPDTGNAVTFGKYAFANNPKLQTVTNISEVLTEIPDGTFESCARLTTVTFAGNKVAAVGLNAFKACISLTNITNLAGLTKIGESAFEGSGLATDVSTWTDGVKLIAKNAFKGTNITTAGFGRGAEIGSGAFENCAKLTALTTFENVTRIGDAAFKNATGLTTLSVGGQTERIGTEAFAGAAGLTKVTFNSAAGIGIDNLEKALGVLTAMEFGYDIFKGATPGEVWIDSTRLRDLVAAYEPVAESPVSTTAVDETLEELVGILGLHFFGVDDAAADTIVNVTGLEKPDVVAVLETLEIPSESEIGTTTETGSETEINTTTTTDTTKKGNGSSGCDLGFGVFALALAGAVVLRKRAA